MKEYHYSELINLIPYGKENAIHRIELREMAGIPDRTVRKLLQEAKEAGEYIINLQDGRGYFRATEKDLAEIESQYRLNESRMISLSKQQKPMRKILKEAGRI